MNEIGPDLQSAPEFISLILVFITVFFDLRYPQIIKDIRKGIPSGEKAKKDLKLGLTNSLLTKSLPIVLINLLSFYLFLPSVIEIIKSYKLSLWNFDFAVSTFVFVAFLISIYLFWSLYLFVLLIIRINKCR